MKMDRKGNKDRLMRLCCMLRNFQAELLLRIWYCKSVSSRVLTRLLTPAE